MNSFEFLDLKIFEKNIIQINNLFLSIKIKLNKLFFKSNFQIFER